MDAQAAIYNFKYFLTKVLLYVYKYGDIFAKKVLLF